MESNSRAVLIIDNSPGITGALKSILHVTDRIDQFSFHYAIPRSVSLANLLKEYGMSVVHIGFVELQKNINVAFYLPALIVNSLRLNSYIRRHRIEVVHVNDLYNMTGIVIKFLNPRIKLVYHIRLLKTSYAGMVYPVWVRLIYKYADKVVAVSDSVARELPASKKLSTIYDAIPAPQENVGDSPVGRPKTLVTFLYLANFTEGKGHVYALEAFAKVKKVQKEVSLIFAGGDLGKEANIQYRQKLEAQVQALHLSRDISFRGFTSDVTELYRSCDAVLNFSVSESFSMVCLEALMHGVPVISSRSGGPEEIIEDGINGLLVENRNVDAMATAMLRLAAEPDFLDQLRKATHRVRNRFSIERSADELRDVYEKLLAGAGR